MPTEDVTTDDGSTPRASPAQSPHLALLAKSLEVEGPADARLQPAVGRDPKTRPVDVLARPLMQVISRST